MKNFKLGLTLAAATTALFACQPKDVKIERPGSTTVNNNNTNNNGPSAADLNKLLMVAVERQFEPLYLLKAALNPQYALEQGLILNTDATTQVMTLTAVNNLKTFDTDKYSSEYAVKYDVQALEKDGNGNLTLLVLKNKPAELIQSVGYIKNGKDKSGKDLKTDFSSKAMNEYISIKATQTPNIYSVEVARTEDTSSKADKQNYLVSTIVSTIEWDGSVAALDNSILMTVKTLKVDRLGNKNAFLKYDQITQAAPIEVKIASCVSATGSVTLTQKVMEKGADGKMTLAKMVDTVVNLNDSSIEIGKSKSPAKDCATRPVVDLTRML